MKQLRLTLITLIGVAFVTGIAFASWAQHGIDWSFHNACDVAACDFDLDGDADAVGLSSEGVVNWYENNGNQVFTMHPIAQGIPNARYIEEGDLDGDGDLDLVVACFSATSMDGGLHRMMNDGTMQFTVIRIPTPYKFYTLAVADMDGDGDADIITTQPYPPFSSSLAVFESTENGQVYVEHTLLTSIGDKFQVIDLDRDGDLDLVGSSSSDIKWLENTGGLTFRRHTVASGIFADEIGAGDLDGDGDIDVFSGEEDSLRWYHNNGQQVFTQITEIPAPLWFGNLMILDVDGDGCADVSGFSTTWGYVRWIENFLWREYDDWTISQPDVGIVSYDTCDFNQDGKIDFAVTGTMTSENIQWYENQSNPTVKIWVTFDAFPIVIPPQGGEFSFDLWIWNTTSDSLTIDFWTSAADEYYGQISREPAILLPNIAMAPNSVLSRRLTQRVPAGVRPLGYIYESKVGVFPDQVFDYGKQIYFIKERPEGTQFGGSDTWSIDAWIDSPNSNAELIPTEMQLTISPNPFNPTTTLTFTLQQAAKVSLEVFDINGRNVGAHGMRPSGGGASAGACHAPLQEAWYDAGTHTITFDGSDLPSGIYFARLTAGGYTAVQKLVLLK